MPLSLKLCCLWFAGVLLPVACWAQTPESEDWNAKFQATYIWQHKRPLAAAYSGPNSLSSEREKSYSFSSTAFLGFRPWTGGEFYINPQVSQGTPFSNETGLGAFTSGDLSAAHDGPPPTLSLTRIFLSQTWGFGGDKEGIESDANQLAGKVDRRRLVLTAGYLYVLDVFDDNAFSHDLRTPGDSRSRTTTMTGRSAPVDSCNRRYPASARSTRGSSGTTATSSKSNAATR